MNNKTTIYINGNRAFSHVDIFRCSPEIKQLILNNATRAIASIIKDNEANNLDTVIKLTTFENPREGVIK